MESYRNRLDLPADLLRRIKSKFAAAGFEVACVIVPSKMSENVEKCWDSVTCFSDPAAVEYLNRVVERSAAIFDTLLFDDFLFTGCGCSRCETERGEQTWGEYRAVLMRKVIREAIIAPARRINPHIKLIVKFPCWYENFYRQGYDLIGDSGLFDEVWAGNETRFEHIPQSKAYWISSYLGKLGKPCGSWYDPLSCSGQIYVEQARNAILTGTAESLLHCYDYLYLGTSAFAQNGGTLTVNKNTDCIDRLKAELTGLKKLAQLVADYAPYGVQTPRKINVDANLDFELQPYYNMLGIPVSVTVELNELQPVIFTAHAAEFDNIADYIQQLQRDKIPYLMSNSAGKILNRPFDFANLLGFESYEEMYELPDLDVKRNYLLSYWGMQFFAPGKVSLLCYRQPATGKHLEVIQNFRREPVKVKFNAENGQRHKIMALPEESAAQFEHDGAITLAEGALLVIGD